MTARSLGGLSLVSSRSRASDLRRRRSGSSSVSPALYPTQDSRRGYLLQDNGAAKHHKMALHVPKAPGFAQMLKDGAKVRLSRRVQRKLYF